MLFKTKNKTETKTKQAFTLAEVLITLSIIGVVAALTIPTLIQRTGNEEYVAKLNKAYSTLAQATEMIMTENGGAKTWATSTENIYKLYKEHLRNSKDCGTASGCFASGYYRYLNGNNWAKLNELGNKFRTFVLADGVSVMVDDSISENCSASWNGTNDTCAHFYVDLNGKKAPNQAGRDLFFLHIKADGLYPAGCDYDACTLTNPSESGFGCACKVILEGDMKY